MADPVSVTQYQTGFAPEVAPFAQDILGGAQALASYQQNPYQRYTGDQVAQFSPLQQQSYDYAQQMTTSPQLQDATALAGQAGLGALNTQYTFKPSDFTSDIAKNMMSPYMQNVVDVQQQQARRAADIAAQQQQAQATTAGAFGGGRDAIARAQGAAELQRNLQGIQATGLQNAYQQAQQQYNTQQQQNAQQQQFGAGLGMQGLQTALTGANALGSLGQTQFAQNTGLIGLQNQLGLQQQQQAQNVLNTQYQNFLNEQNDPYKRLGFYSDIVRGAPLTQTGSSVYQAAPTGLQNLTSLGLGAYGLSSLFGTPKTNKEGGAIKGYATGGSVLSPGFKDYAVSHIDPRQLPLAQQNAQARGDIQVAQDAAEQMAQDAAMRRGIASALPVGTEVVRAAGGGILAFDEGGKTPKPKAYSLQDLLGQSMGYQYTEPTNEQYQQAVTGRRAGLGSLYGESEVDPLIQEDTARRQAQIARMDAQTNPLIALRASAALQKSGVTPSERWGSMLGTVAEGAEKAQAAKAAAEDSLMKAKLAGAAAKQARKDGQTDKALSLEDAAQARKNDAAKFTAQAAGHAAQVVGNIEQAKISAGPHWAAAARPTDLQSLQRDILQQKITADPTIVNDPAKLAAARALAGKEAADAMGRYPGSARIEAAQEKANQPAIEMALMQNKDYRKAMQSGDFATAGKIKAQIEASIGSRAQPGVEAPSVAPAIPNIPKAGTVQQGYRFKGGDPSKPSSWEKVQ